MKAFITTYALTAGIIEAEGDTHSNYFSPSEEKYKHLFVPKRNWFHTKDEAIKAAESMRLEKIKSVKSSLKKLE